MRDVLAILISASRRHSLAASPLLEENDMRLMALMLVAVLATCFVDSASATHRYGYYGYYGYGGYHMYRYWGNPDRGPYPTSRYCERRARC